jgi:hypothetical protein
MYLVLAWRTDNPPKLRPYPYHPHPTIEKTWVSVKMREAIMLEGGLIRRLADFLRKVLQDYTGEHRLKPEVYQSVTQTAIPPMGSRKRDSSSDDAETIDLRELDKTPQFQDRQYGIRKDCDTLMIGNSTANLDEPGVITISGKRFKLREGLWELLTRKDVITDTISPKEIKRYNSILQMTSAHLTGFEAVETQSPLED